MYKKLVVTIDGPVASGKTTLAKMVAKQVGYVFLSTGLLYRAVAYKVFKLALENSVDDEDTVLRATLGQTYTFRVVNGESRLFLDMKDCTDELSADVYSMLASKVSMHQRVRKALLEIQQRFGHEGGVVAEGRDTGRIVFPDANLKYFLKADVEFRSRMRYGDLIRAGVTDVSIDDVREEIEKRDFQDTQGEKASLQCTKDMIIIDTTDEDLSKIAEVITNDIKFAQDQLSE